jgi:hypothetical protein
VLSLTSEVRARDAFINMLQTEKKEQFDRLWNYTTKIGEMGREIGSLEARLSLGAPNARYPHVPKEPLASRRVLEPRLVWVPEIETKGPGVPRADRCA